MTVRLLLTDRRRRRPARQRVWAEYLFLFAGLIALDYYIWVNVDEVFSQAYDNWSLDQQIAGLQPSLRGFVADRLRIPSLAPPPPPTVPEEKASRKRLAEFALIGRVEVPRLRLSAVVREGVDDDTLRKAVGHVPSTALPGDPGNVAIAAHRDTLFRKLRDIRKNDRISLETVDNTYSYVVESMTIVKPSDVSVLKAMPGDQVLTLITCYPFNYIGSAPKRFIVKARQVNVAARTTTRTAPSSGS